MHKAKPKEPTVDFWMRWKAARSENRGHPEWCKAPRGRSPTGLGRKGQLSVIKGNAADLAKTMPNGRNVKDYIAFTEKH